MRFSEIQAEILKVKGPVVGGSIFLLLIYTKILKGTLNGLEINNSRFEFNPRLNGEPMQGFHMSGHMGFPRQSTCKPAQCVLYELQSMDQVFSGDTTQKRVEIVKLTAKQSISQYLYSSLEVQTPPN